MSQIRIDIDACTGTADDLDAILQKLTDINRRLQAVRNQLSNDILESHGISYRFVQANVSSEDLQNSLNALTAVIRAAVSLYPQADRDATNRVLDALGVKQVGSDKPWWENLIEGTEKLVSGVEKTVENDVVSTVDWFEKNKEFIGKLAFDTAILLGSVALIVGSIVATGGMDLPVAICAGFAIVNQIDQVVNDVRAIGINEKGDTVTAEEVADHNLKQDLFEPIFGKQSGDMVYDVVDTATTLVSLTGGAADGVESFSQAICKDDETLTTFGKITGGVMGSTIGKFGGDMPLWMPVVTGTENVAGVAATSKSHIPIVGGVVDDSEDYVHNLID